MRLLIREKQSQETRGVLLKAAVKRIDEIREVLGEASFCSFFVGARFACDPFWTGDFSRESIEAYSVIRSQQDSKRCSGRSKRTADRHDHG